MGIALKNLFYLISLFRHCPCTRINSRVLDEKAANKKQRLNHWRRERD